MTGFTDDELMSHRPAMYSFAMSLSRNHDFAEDLVQDTLVKALIHRDKFIKETKLRAWLFTILRNHFYTKNRKKTEIGDEDDILTAHLVAPDNLDIALEAKQVIKQIRYLPGDMRRALVAVAALGGSYEEAADSMGVSIGTIKSRVNRAREILERGKFQDITNDEFEQPVEAIGETDNTKWFDTIRILFKEYHLDISEIAKKTGLPKLEVIEAIAAMKLKRKAQPEKELVDGNLG